MWTVKDKIKALLYNVMNMTSLYTAVFITGCNMLFDYISDNID